jgi:hypothetical protein
LFDVRHVYRPLTSGNLLDTATFGILKGQCDRLSNAVVLGTVLPELSGELVTAELLALRHLSGLQVVLASDLRSHVLRKVPQPPREPRSRDQLGASACASKRRLSAPHHRAARSRASRASNKGITMAESAGMPAPLAFIRSQLPALQLTVRSQPVNAE